MVMLITMKVYSITTELIVTLQVELNTSQRVPLLLPTAFRVIYPTTGDSVELKATNSEVDKFKVFVHLTTTTSINRSSLLKL